MSAFVLGLDLGQTNDYSALVVIERLTQLEAPYAVRHLRRWRLGTPYTQVVADVAKLLRSPALAGAPVVVDQTGVGRAVVDVFRQQVHGTRVIPITITAGQHVNMTPDGIHVPKRDLAMTLQRVLGARRLVVAPGLAEASALMHELANFQVRITDSANETFGAGGEAKNDDLVLALCLGCWWAERWEQEALSIAGARSVRITSAGAGVP